jgi:uncharacterized membrane protein
MKTFHHLILAAISIILWLVYFLGGLPFHYFQDFSISEAILLLLISFFAVLPFFAIIVLTFMKLPFLKTSVWLAFYGSLLPFILDYMVVGIIGGHGLHFLVTHWYLTVGYIGVWIILPVLGKTLEQLAIRILDQRF